MFALYYIVISIILLIVVSYITYDYFFVYHIKMNGEQIIKLNLKDKKVTFLFYSGSGEGEKAVKRVKKEYPEAQIFILKEPKKHPEELSKIIEL